MIYGIGDYYYDSIKSEVVNPKTLNLPFGDGYDHPSMVIVVMVNLIGFYHITPVD